MKSLKNNWSELNDVGVICNEKKQKKTRKDKLNYEGRENELGWKKDHPKDPLNNG
jgi:hypothetical protein